MVFNGVSHTSNMPLYKLTFTYLLGEHTSPPQPNCGKMRYLATFKSTTFTYLLRCAVATSSDINNSSLLGYA